MKLVNTFSDQDRNLAKLIIVTPIMVFISSLYVITAVLYLENIFNVDILPKYNLLISLIILCATIMLISYFVLTDYYLDPEDKE